MFLIQAVAGKFEGLHGCGPLTVLGRELVEHSELLDRQGVGSVQQDCQYDDWYPIVSEVWL